MAAILANISMFSLLFWQHPEWPLLGGQYWLGAYPDPGHPLVQQGIIQATTPIGGIAFYTSTIAGLQDWLLPIIAPARYGLVFASFDKSSINFSIHVIF